MSANKILANKYRLIEELNRGGMGSVWRAEHVELGTPAAVKLIDPVLARTDEALRRFRREAQSAASLRSSNIVQIFDYGVDQGRPYIAMELLRGKSLAYRLSERGHLSPEETSVILSQVGKAVAWAHSMGIVHRDLKPDNVFLAEDAGETVVKLLDFGIAKSFEGELLEASPETMTGTMMGTPYYMSPEQASGKRPVDSRSDVWAFAVIAYECLTGERPFFSNTLGGLVLRICSEKMPVPSSVASVPLGFDEWFARAANRDIEQRYQTVREAERELRRICLDGTDEEAIVSLFGSEIRTGRETTYDSEVTTATIEVTRHELSNRTTGGFASTRPQNEGHLFYSLLAVGAAVTLGTLTVLLVDLDPKFSEPMGSGLPQMRRSAGRALVAAAMEQENEPKTATSAEPQARSDIEAIKDGLRGHTSARSHTERMQLPRRSHGLRVTPSRTNAPSSSVPSVPNVANDGPQSQASSPDLDALVGF